MRAIRVEGQSTGLTRFGALEIGEQGELRDYERGELLAPYSMRQQLTTQDLSIYVLHTLLPHPTRSIVKQLGIEDTLDDDG